MSAPVGGTISLRCTCPPTRFEKGDAAHELGCPVGDWISGAQAALKERCTEFYLEGSPHERCDLEEGHGGPHHFKTETVEVRWRS